jgi:hypothetical protein
MLSIILLVDKKFYLIIESWYFLELAIQTILVLFKVFNKVDILDELSEKQIHIDRLNRV